MIKPNYSSGSIVNLVSTILKYYGIKYNYEPIDIQDLQGHKQMVFIVIDGMGFSFLEKHAKGSFLYSNYKKSLTSVFPSTTSAALTSLMTGTAPQQHGLTGWYMYFKELATAGLSLPFTARFTNYSLSELQVNINDIYDFQTIFQKINNTMMLITPIETINSAFSKFCYGDKPKKGYKDINQCFNLLKEELTKDTEMIYVYVPHFDEIAHMNGINSQDARNVFFTIDKVFNKIVDENKKSDILYIVTADHGLIDTKPHEIINLNDYQEIKDCLILPLCGDPRVAYCYVRANKLQKFRELVRKKLSPYCDMYSIEDMIDDNFFGLFDINPKLYSRIGDEILIMKDHYVLTDHVYREQHKQLIGFHGGLSPDEMIVPLITVRK